MQSIPQGPLSYKSIYSKIISQSQPNLEEVETTVYSNKYCITDDKKYVFTGLTDNSVKIYQVGQSEIQEILNLKDFHKKMINQIIFNEKEKLLFTCSNDCSIHIYDMNSNKIIKTFKKNPLEIKTISQSQHILAGGVDNASVIFWDLQKMKERCIFSESFSEEITYVYFSKIVATSLMAASTEGLVTLFDLTQNDEANSSDFSMRFDQPIERCEFIGHSPNMAFAATSVQEIHLIDMENSKLAKSVQAIDYNEFNEDYLIDVYQTNNLLTYYLGSKDGHVKEYQILEGQQQNCLKQIQTKHSHITWMQPLNEDFVVSGGEEGTIQICQKSDELNNQIKELEQEYFMEIENEQNVNGGQKKQSKLQKFNPN